MRSKKTQSIRGDMSTSILSSPRLFRRILRMVATLDTGPRVAGGAVRPLFTVLLYLINAYWASLSSSAVSSGWSQGAIKWSTDSSKRIP